MKASQRYGVFDCHLGCELAAALARADHFSRAGPAVHVVARLQLDQVAAVANDDSLTESLGDGSRHRWSLLIQLGPVGGFS